MKFEVSYTGRLYGGQVTVKSCKPILSRCVSTMWEASVVVVIQWQATKSTFDFWRFVSRHLNLKS